MGYRQRSQAEVGSMRSINDLLYKHFNKPALVIGGGPSVLTDLPLLPEEYFDAVFSANEHAFKQSKFKADYIVNVDKRHSVTQEYMRNRLKPYGAPIINSHSWADYRLLNWRFAANSGITAVAIAVALGCNPIVTTGIDCWQTNQLYFHSDTRARAPGQKFRPYFLEQLSQFVRSRQGAYANLRALSGPVKDRFGAFHIDELLPAPLLPHPYRMERLSQTPVRVKVRRAFTFSVHDTVTAGTILTVSQRELHSLIPRASIEVLS